MARIRTKVIDCPCCDGSGERTVIDPRSLREVRKAAGLALREVARRTRLSPAHLSDVELGRRGATERVLRHYRKMESPEAEE